MKSQKMIAALAECGYDRKKIEALGRTCRESLTALYNDSRKQREDQIKQESWINRWQPVAPITGLRPEVANLRGELEADLREESALKQELAGSGGEEFRRLVDKLADVRARIAAIRIRLGGAK